MSTDVVGAIADSVTAAAALLGIVVAYRGLRTWQEELHGRTEYDLARRILISLYRLRDGLRRVRHPAMMGHEYAGRPGHDPSVVGNPDDIAYAYQSRWESVSTPFIELDAALLEAEAHWGNWLSPHVRALRELVANLRLRLGQYIRAQKDPDYASGAYGKQVANVEQTIWEGYSSEDEDSFSKQMEAIIVQFEASLRPKLRRR